MNAMQILSAPMAQALGWALLHLVWQATIVAGILAAVLALVPRRSATTRYAASITALAVVFVLFVATAVRTYDPAAAAQSGREAEVVSLQTASVPALIATIATETWRDRLVDAISSAQQALPSVVAIWLAGVALLSSRLMMGWLRARRLVTKNAVPARERWQQAAERLSDALGLRRTVRLLESAAIEVPSVIGSLRPVILLPASTLTGLTPAQIEMVLAHELAHIRRHDFLVNLLQACVETLMFYHPAVWWISSRVRMERENCCDDLAVSVCGDPLQYARALTRLEELRDDTLSIAVAANGGSLLERVRRIATERAESTAVSARWIAGVGVMLIILLAVALPSLPALAQRDENTTAPHARLDVYAPGDEDLDDVDPDAEIDMDDDFDYEGPEAPEAPEPPETPDLDLDLDLDLDIPMDLGVTVPTPVAPPAPVMPGMAAPHPAPTPAMAPMPVVAPHAPTPPALARNGFAWEFGDDDDADAKAEARARERHRERDANRDRAIASDGKLTVDELIALRSVGVTPDFVESMRSIFPNLTIGHVTSMAAVGVTAEYVRDMRAAGIATASPREVTSLRAVGVTADYVRQMRDAGFEVKTAREATSLRAVGVTPEFLASMRSVGLDISSAKTATSLSAVGVTAEWVRTMRDAGVKIEDARDATSLRAVGVTPEFVKRLAAAGYSNLTTRELARLAAAGVDDDFIRDLEQYRKNKNK